MKLRFKEWDCELVERFYSNGRLALCLVDPIYGDPIATATVNLPELPLPEGMVIIKDYSENEGMLATLQEAHIIGDIEFTTSNGLVNFYICKYLLATSHKDATH